MPHHRDRPDHAHKSTRHHHHRRRSLGTDYPPPPPPPTTYSGRSEYPHSSTTHSEYIYPGESTVHEKAGLMTRLKHGGQTTVERPRYDNREQSFGNETTAATVDGPTSSVPKHLRKEGFGGYGGVGAGRPMIGQSNATLGDRIHGAAKQVVGRVTLDQKKVEEGRVMQFGGGGLRGEQVMEPGYREGGARRRGRKYYY